MNKVLLIGRMTRDPELRVLASGKSVTTFAVTTNEYLGNGSDKAEHHCKGKVCARSAECASSFSHRRRMSPPQLRLDTVTSSSHDWHRAPRESRLET
jgi:single-stranded DNA-binding protein